MNPAVYEIGTCQFFGRACSCSLTTWKYSKKIHVTVKPKGQPSISYLVLTAMGVQMSDFPATMVLYLAFAFKIAAIDSDSFVS